MRKLLAAPEQWRRRAGKCTAPAARPHNPGEGAAARAR